MVGGAPEWEEESQEIDTKSHAVPELRSLLRRNNLNCRSTILTEPHIQGCLQAQLVQCLAFEGRPFTKVSPQNDAKTGGNGATATLSVSSKMSLPTLMRVCCAVTQQAHLEEILMRNDEIARLKAIIEGLGG